MHGQNLRRRVVIACDPCRKSRRKCDGAEPTCEPCQKKGRPCKYSYEVDRRKPPSRDQVTALSKKIEQLESKLSKLAHHRDFSKMQDETTQLTNDVSYRNNNDESENARYTDQIDPFGKLNVGEDGQLRCYGPRSSISFISRKLNIISPEKVVAQRMEAMKAAVIFGKSYEISEDLKGHLLELFWTFQNSSLCLVPQDLFLAEMSSGLEGKFYSLALLSAMLSVGARFSDRLEVRLDSLDRSTAGFQYADLARLLLSYEREYPSLTTVQANAVLAIFYIYVDMEAAAWDLTGSAIRNAFTLGINLLYESWVEDGDFSEDEEKAGRIVWWGCYVLDKIVSNILGRPVMIKRHNITCLVPTEECINEYSTWWHPLLENHVLNGSQSRLFSTATFMIELYMISSDPLDHIHLAFHPKPKSEIESIVNDANLELIEFERALPNFMRLARARKEPLLPHIYVFHMRYCHIQILIHRSLCLRNDRQPQNLDNEDDHQRLCRIHANSITKTIQEYQAIYGLNNVEFATPDYLCTAAIVHLYLSEGTDKQIFGPAIKNFGLCVSALKEIRSCNLWSQRALGVLQILAQEWRLDHLFNDVW